MKREIFLLIALLWAFVAEARVNDNESSRVRGDVARKLEYLGESRSSLIAVAAAKDDKKNDKKDDSDGDGGGPRNDDEEDNKNSDKKDDSDKDKGGSRNDDDEDDDGDDDDDSDDGLLSLLPDWFDYLRPCKLLAEQFFDSINCEVMLLVPLLIERQIKFEIYTDEICDPLTGRICATPGFEGIIDFDDRWVSSNIFYEDISIGPINIGTLNFGLDLCLDRSDGNGTDDDVGNDDTGGNRTSRMLMEGSILKLGTEYGSSTVTELFVDNPGLCTCEVSLAGYACDSCEFCADGGVNFDCSNIVMGLTNNGSCDSLERPLSLFGNGNKINATIPDFLQNIDL